MREGFRGSGQVSGGRRLGDDVRPSHGEHDDSLEHHEQLRRRKPTRGVSLGDRGPRAAVELLVRATSSRKGEAIV
jgi:hypothetical protein